VKDVNRGRCIKVDAVMEPPPQSESRPLPKLKSGLTLEIAAKELTNSSYDAAFVTADSGQPLGLISLRQITAALSSGSAA
ncbi:CBS domain-containing protein, partial [Mesorhizobium sp. M4A.F.Ca.ET.020.02.1.1]|uniref:CBS domain-containing protein n=1 Tax=Mesorhizobium sp. M4A.F.Ca.ET.020.02.1.1 TaxID=2496652 RepID=UPI001AED05E1